MINVNMPQGPTIACVLYEKHIDTHAIVSVTIPVSGIYKIEKWGAPDYWVEEYHKAGEVVGPLEALYGKTCPGYNDVKVRK